MCWSSGMGLGRVISNIFTYSNLHPTNHKLVNIMLQHLWWWDKPRATLDSQDSPRPRIERSHHLPPYSIFCASPQSSHPNDLFVLGLPKGSPETAKVGLPQLCGTITSCLNLRLGWGRKQSFSSRWELSNGVWHSIYTHEKLGRFLTFCGRESNCQFDSRPFFFAITCVTYVLNGYKSSL